MQNTMILHHYELSPYGEKVRLMFGLAGVPWQSVLSPEKPPRPHLDPLTGGYRRIPVAQLGADIFCDTSLIAREIVAMTGCVALDAEPLTPATKALMERAEKEIFFAAITAVPPLRLLGTLVRTFGLKGTLDFAKDRSSMLKGGTVRPLAGPRAKAALTNFVEALEDQLADQDWAGGNAPSIADLAIFHPLWLHVTINRKPLKAGPKVQDWYARVEAIGHDKRDELSGEQAFAAARDAEPRPLPATTNEADIATGTPVQVAPSDYGLVPVTGKLAALTPDRIIVARDTADFGTVHVHFPRAGYTIKAC